MSNSVQVDQPVIDQMKRTYHYADGSYLTKEGGTVAWRNNNEGNLRPGSLSSNRIGVDKKNFAIFATPEDGRLAKKKLLFRSDAYKKYTLTEAIKKYAPESDGNNPKKYAAFILKKAKIDDKLMGKYESDEQTRIMEAMKIQEGYKEGKISTYGSLNNLSNSSSEKQTISNFIKESNDKASIKVVKAALDLDKALAYNKKQDYSTDQWKQIQQVLNNEVGANLHVDGIVGKETTKAIYDYQVEENLSTDGKCGQHTFKSLKSRFTSKVKNIASSVKNKVKSTVSKVTSKSSKIKIPSGSTIMSTSYTPDLDLLYRHATQEGYAVKDIRRSSNYVAKYCTSGSSQHQCTRGTSLMLQLASYARGEAKREYVSSCKAHLFGSVNPLTKYNISSSVAGEYSIHSGNDKTKKSNMDAYIKQMLKSDGDFVTFKYAASQHIVFHSNSGWYSDFKQGSAVGCGNENTYYSNVHFFNR